MKKINKEKMYVFFIILLSVLLVGLFVLTTTGLFYKGEQKSDLSFQAGKSFVIDVEKTGCEVMSFEFDGAFLSGEFLKQNILIKNSEDSDFFVRAKVEVFCENRCDLNVEVDVLEGWTRKENEYLFDGVLSASSTIGFCKGFSLDEKEQLESSKRYILTFCVETLSTEFDRVAVWGY